MTDTATTPHCNQRDNRASSWPVRWRAPGLHLLLAAALFVPARADPHPDRLASAYEALARNDAAGCYRGFEAHTRLGTPSLRAEAHYWAGECARFHPDLRQFAPGHAQLLSTHYPGTYHARLSYAQRHLGHARSTPASRPPFSHQITLAVIDIESGHRPRARSPKGAIGLMQVLPSTARELLGSHQAHHAMPCLVDARCNVRLGTTYLARQLKTFDHDLTAALYAYHAGARRARSWVQQRSRHPILAIDRIPIHETRKYVRNVYQALWNRQAHARILSRSLTSLARGRWPTSE